MHPLRVLLLGVLLLTVALASPREVREDGPGATRLDVTPLVVPVDVATRHIAIDVAVGDHGPYRFQLDTGASIAACVDDDLARELGLRVVGSALNGDGSGRNDARKPLVAIDRLAFGNGPDAGVLFEDVVALVDDYDWIGRGDRRVHGLLGYPLFRDLLLSIDYARSEITLERGALTLDDPHVVAHHRPDAPDVDVTVGGVPVRVLLDTGSRGGLRLPDATLAHVETDGPVRTVGRVRTVNNTLPLRAAILAQTVRIAGHDFDRLEAGFVDLGPVGLAGYALLDDFVLTFDPQRRLVRFTPAAR